jgi:hypothetical protein
VASCPEQKGSTKETHRPICCELRGHCEHWHRWSNDVSKMPNSEQPVSTCGPVKLASCFLRSRRLPPTGEAAHGTSAAAGFAGKLDLCPGRNIFAVFWSCARHSPFVQTPVPHTPFRLSQQGIQLSFWIRFNSCKHALVGRRHTCPVGHRSSHGTNRRTIPRFFNPRATFPARRSIDLYRATQP